MIIPIKCFTCGTLIADKYRFYITHINEEKAKSKQSTDPIYFSNANNTKSPEGHLMDKLGLNKQCCRRHMLTHVDIE
jgi:DNA-directed RNA polymerase I, II, and III subunit RPABC5